MKDDRGFIKKMLDYCDLISSDLSGLGGDFDSFMSDEKVQRLCSFSLIQIGEYARRISYDTRKRYSDVDWIGIISMRNVITHNYENIDARQMWNTVTEDVSELRERLIEILKQMDSESVSDVKHL
jgi:uncharacterized protein with HEPN domain